MLNITKKRLYKIKKTKKQTKKRLPKRRKRKKRKKRKKKSFRRGKKSYNLKNKSLKKIKGGGDNDSFKVLELDETSKIITLNKYYQPINAEPIKFNNEPSKLEKLKNLSFKVEHFNEENNKGVYNPLTLPVADPRSLIWHQKWMIDTEGVTPISNSLTKSVLEKGEEEFQDEFIKELFDSFKQKFEIFNNTDKVEANTVITKFEILHNDGVLHVHEFDGKSEPAIKIEVPTSDNIDSSTNILASEQEELEAELNALSGDDTDVEELGNFSEDDLNNYFGPYITLNEIKEQEELLQQQNNESRVIENNNNDKIKQIKTDTNNEINNQKININNLKVSITAKHLKEMAHFMKIIDANKDEYNQHISAIKEQIKEEKEKTKEENTDYSPNVPKNSWLLKRHNVEYLKETFKIPESYAKYVSDRLKMKKINKLENKQKGGADEDDVDSELAELLAIFKLVDISDDITQSIQDGNMDILATKLKKIDPVYSPDNTSGVTHSELLKMFGIDKEQIGGIQNEIKQATENIADNNEKFKKIAEILAKNLSPDGAALNDAENQNESEETLKTFNDENKDEDDSNNNNNLQDPLQTLSGNIINLPKSLPPHPNANKKVVPPPPSSNEATENDTTKPLKSGYTRPQVYLHAKLRLDKDGNPSDYQPDFTIESFGFHKDAREWLKHVNIDVD